MEERISLILKAKNVNASQFADEIGVQRSSISHVLSGRNKPSLEFIQKILKRYTDINPDWLLFGKGPMHQETNLFSTINEPIPLKDEAISRALGRNERGMISVSKPKPRHEGTYEESEIESYPIKPAQNTEFNQSFVKSTQIHVNEAVKPVEVNVTQSSAEKQVEKILVFYKDRSFREYNPE